MREEEPYVKTIEQPNKKPRPQKWWHWVLMYPGLLIFMMGNVPTLQQFYYAKKHNVPFTDGYQANKRDSIMERNFRDLDVKNFESAVISRNGVTFDYRIFDSGDIMIWTSTKDNPGRIHWIGHETLIPSSRGSLFSVDEAFAGDWRGDAALVSGGKKIICRKRLGSGRILVRVRYGSGGCYDEVIETGSGRVLSKRRSSCSSSCE